MLKKFLICLTFSMVQLLLSPIVKMSGLLTLMGFLRVIHIELILAVRVEEAVEMIRVEGKIIGVV